MASRNREHYIMLGVGSIPNKCLIAYRDKRIAKWSLAIGGLKGEYKRGDTPALEDLDGVYTTIHFCNKKSIEIFRDTLNFILEHWEDADNG